MRVRQIT